MSRSGHRKGAMNPLVVRIPQHDKWVLDIHVRQERSSLSAIVRRAIQQYLRKGSKRIETKGDKGRASGSL